MPINIYVYIIESMYSYSDSSIVIIMINSMFSFSKTYIVGVEACCIGNSCLKQTNFRALIDSGTSFTFLPDEVYEKITKEVDIFILNNVMYSHYQGLMQLSLIV